MAHDEEALRRLFQSLRMEVTSTLLKVAIEVSHFPLYHFFSESHFKLLNLNHIFLGTRIVPVEKLCSFPILGRQRAPSYPLRGDAAGEANIPRLHLRSESWSWHKIPHWGLREVLLHRGKQHFLWSVLRPQKRGEQPQGSLPDVKLRKQQHNRVLCESRVWLSIWWYLRDLITSLSNKVSDIMNVFVFNEFEQNYCFSI